MSYKYELSVLYIMKLFEVTNPKMSPELVKYLTKLNILDKTTISPSGKLIVDCDVAIPIPSASFQFPFETVSGHFYCSHTKITSLVGAPQSIGGDFACAGTKITSLAGAPQSIGGNFYCMDTGITSLEHVPQTIGGSFRFYYTNITSLKGIHKTHRNWKVGGALHLPKGCTDIVGLALIEGINKVRINAVSFDISDHDPHSFQEKLLDAGMRAQARM